MRWLLLTMICISTLNANALSFNYDKLGKGEKLKPVSATVGHANPAEPNQFERECVLTSIQLFTSPLQPGGKYMLGVNWMNVLRLVAPKVAAKMDNARTPIERLAMIFLECDEDIRALNADPRPDRDYKTKLLELKRKKWPEKLEYVSRMR